MSNLKPSDPQLM